MISVKVVSWCCSIFFKGTARYGKTYFPTMPVQLPTDYKTVTSFITPDKKASIMQNVSNLFLSFLWHLL